MRDIVRIYGLIAMSSVLQGTIKPILGLEVEIKSKDKKKEVKSYWKKKNTHELTHTRKFCCIFLVLPINFK